MEKNNAQSNSITKLVKTATTQQSVSPRLTTPDQKPSSSLTRQV